MATLKSLEEMREWLKKSILICDVWPKILADSPIIEWAKESKEMMQAILAALEGPSVTPEDIDYFCEEMESALTSHSAKGSEQRNVEESYLKWLCKKIGVEAKEGKDER